jgi:hypothetical protein
MRFRSTHHAVLVVTPPAASVTFGLCPPEIPPRSIVPGRKVSGDGRWSNLSTIDTTIRS